MIKRQKNIIGLIVIPLVVIMFPFIIGCALRFYKVGYQLFAFVLNCELLFMSFGILFADFIVRNVFRIINEYDVITERVLLRRFIYWFSGIFFVLCTVVIIAGGTGPISFMNTVGLISASIISMSVNMTPIYLGKAYLLISLRIIARTDIVSVEILPNKKGIEYTNIFLEDGEVIKVYLEKDIAKSFVKELSGVD